MRIALASCEELPDWEVDDRHLHTALRRAGVDFAVVPWSSDVDWSSFSAVWLRTTWDYTERLPAFLAWAERTASVTRLLNPWPVIRWNTRKSYLAELAAAGVPVAPTRRLVGEAGVVGPWLAAHGASAGFLKPEVGATARRTLRFVADAAGIEAAEAHIAACGAAHPLLLQPYLRSVELEGEWSALLADGEVTHAVQKVPVPGDYRVQDDFGATDRRVALSDELAALVRQTMDTTARLLGLEEPLLYARVDALRDGHGRLVLNELEVVEPSLFLRHAPEAAERWVAGLLRRVGGAA